MSSFVVMRNNLLCGGSVISDFSFIGFTIFVSDILYIPLKRSHCFIL